MPYRLVFVFNEEVQLDLVFFHSQVQPDRGLITVLHMIDVACRWAMACVIEDRTEEDICTAAPHHVDLGVWTHVHLGP